MKPQTLFGTRGRRGLAGSLSIGIGALILAMPASATKPQPSLPSTSLSVSTCTFTVTYTWAGIHGGGFSANLGLLEDTGQVIAYAEVARQSGRRGSVSYDFVLASDGSTSRKIFARGALVKRGFVVDGSLTDSPVVSSTCGYPAP